MWPMVAGVGPIVGEGILGFFVDPDSVVSTWRYVQGKSLLDAATITQAGDPYELMSPDPPVAVLTDGRTASSGEATTIAFRGRPHARSFGEPTWGVSTAHRGYLLSHGARPVLRGAWERQSLVQKAPARGGPDPAPRQPDRGMIRDEPAGGASGPLRMKGRLV